MRQALVLLSKVAEVPFHFFGPNSRTSCTSRSSSGTVHGPFTTALRADLLVGFPSVQLSPLFEEPNWVTEFGLLRGDGLPRRSLPDRRKSQFRQNRTKRYFCTHIKRTAQV